MHLRPQVIPVLDCPHQKYSRLKTSSVTHTCLKPSCSRYSFTDPERMEGRVNPGPGCKEQLAHVCCATACSQRDWNPDLAIVSPAC